MFGGRTREDWLQALLIKQITTKHKEYIELERFFGEIEEMSRELAGSPIFLLALVLARRVIVAGPVISDLFLSTASNSHGAM